MGPGKFCEGQEGAVQVDQGDGACGVRFQRAQKILRRASRDTLAHAESGLVVREGVTEKAI